MFWAQSATKNYIRAENKVQSAANYLPYARPLPLHTRILECPYVSICRNFQRFFVISPTLVRWRWADLSNARCKYQLAIKTAYFNHSISWMHALQVNTAFPHQHGRRIITIEKLVAEFPVLLCFTNVNISHHWDSILPYKKLWKTTAKAASTTIANNRFYGMYLHTDIPIFA